MHPVHVCGHYAQVPVEAGVIMSASVALCLHMHTKPQFYGLFFFLVFGLKTLKLEQAQCIKTFADRLDNLSLSSGSKQWQERINSGGLFFNFYRAHPQNRFIRLAGHFVNPLAVQTISTPRVRPLKVKLFLK